MPRKPLSRPTRPHAADIAAVRSILNEAQKQEVVRLARSPDRLPPASVIKRLGSAEVQQLDESRIRLGSLWEERPAAVVWLRHYG